MIESGPVAVLSAVSVSEPAPSFVIAPVPPSTPVNVTSSERLKTSDPAFATSPAIDPTVPPSPRTSVPAVIVVGPVAVLSATSVSVPVPFCAMPPPPDTVPENTRLSERAKASVPLVRTSPASEPVVPPSPIWSVPAAIVVPPAWVAAPVTTSVPAPCFVSDPLPEMSPPKVDVSERSKTSAPSLATSPESEPEVPPSPTLSVPYPIVVPPEKLLLPVRVSVPAPIFVTAPAPEMAPA